MTGYGDRQASGSRGASLEQAPHVASPKMPPESDRRSVLPVDRWLLVALILVASYMVWQLSSLRTTLSRLAADSKEELFWELCHSEAGEMRRATVFRQLVEGGNTEWRSANLQRLPLADVSLVGADLRGGDFESSDLRKADLSRCLLQRTQLPLVDLSDANLSEAALDGVNLTKAVVSNARFDKARLVAATLQQISGEGASFIRADLSEADLLMSNFSRANFAGADLTSARLRSAVFREAKLTLADLAGADLASIDLTNSNWWRSRGLRSDQLSDFADRFAPTETADPRLQEDFLQWLESSVAAPAE